MNLLSVIWVRVIALADLSVYANGLGGAVSFLNDLFGTIFLGNAWIAVVLISLAAGYGAKKRYNAGWLFWFSATFLVYCTLSYFGLGA